MFRKPAALMFIMVMTLLVTMKHPVLGYCICNNSYNTSETTSPSEPSGSCLCCTHEAGNTDPCEDCSMSISLDVGDFLWSTSLDDDAHTVSVNSPSPSLPNLLSSGELPRNVCSRVLDTRDTPPPGVNASDENLPIFLRHSVLII